jgi:hypothetical protein
MHAPGGIRSHDRGRRAAVDLRLRPRGHWDRRLTDLSIRFIKFVMFVRPSVRMEQLGSQCTDFREI